MIQLEFDICMSSKSIDIFLSSKEKEKEKDDINKEKDDVNKYKYDQIFEELLNIEKYPLMCNLKNIKSQKNSIPLSSINIGDIISLEFMPYSQKYIDFYDQNIGGKVFFIDVKNDNAFMYYDTYRKSKKKHIRTICSIERDWCSYFGDSRGYAFFIYKN